LELAFLALIAFVALRWLCCVQRSETALHTAVEQSAGAEVVEALLVAGANYDVTEKVRAASTRGV